VKLDEAVFRNRPSLQELEQCSDRDIHLCALSDHETISFTRREKGQDIWLNNTISYPMLFCYASCTHAPPGAYHWKQLWRFYF